MLDNPLLSFIFVIVFVVFDYFDIKLTFGYDTDGKYTFLGRVFYYFYCLIFTV